MIVDHVDHDRWLVCEREQCEVSGWCPSLVRVSSGMAVVCAAVVLPGPVSWPVPHLIPVQYSSVLLSCDVLFSAECVVCGGVCVSVLFVWWGSLVCTLPGIGAGWGHCGWWGGMTRWGGMVMEGRRC